MLVPGPAAVVSGWEATVLAVALRDLQRRHYFARLPVDQRSLVDAAIADLEQTGKLSGAVRSVPERSTPAAVLMVAHSGLRGCSELLSITEIAEILGVSVSTVRRLKGTGDLPAVRVGRSVRIRKVDVDELVERRRSA